MAKKIGRPTLYSEKLADEICQTVARNTIGLAHICERNSHFPTPETIRVWRLTKPAFSAKYAQSKADQIDFLVEEALEVSRADGNDTIIDDDGMAKCNHDWIGRSRLHVDTIKWYASKLAPKIYGDRQRIEDLESKNEDLKAEMAALREQLDEKYKKDF